MIFHHPALARLTCEECQNWIVDIKTAEKLIRGGKPQKRKPHQPTPCAECPRKSPKNERRYRLMPCNDTTLMLFFAVQGGVSLSPEEAQDPIVRKNFAALKIIYNNWQQRNEADELTTTLFRAGIIGKNSG
ncbi:MAG: hypothetical protein HN975_02000 [Anaerolineae bacterium]|jgi:hypothetical protein|nr:hypothetical protein [Anaerolineae bacterium]